MPAPHALHRSRHALSLALCAGVIALAGCPKMPRITPPTPSPDASASPSGEPTPSAPPSTEPSTEPEPKRDFLAVGEHPRSIALDASGNGYVSLVDDLVRVQNAAGDLRSAATSSLKATFPSFDLGTPSGLALIGNVTWFADTARKQVRKIGSGSEGQTEDSLFGDAPTLLAADPSLHLWMADSVTRTVGLLPAGSAANASPVTATLKGIPSDLKVDPSGTAWALVTANGEVHISKLTRPSNASTVTIVAETKLGGLSRGIGIALDEQNGVWLTGTTPEGDGQLLKIDRESGSPIDIFTLKGFVPGRFAIRGNHAWIPDDSDSGTTLSKISLTNGAVVTTYPLEGRGSEVFKDTSGDLWIPLRNRRSVVKLDF